MFGLLGRAYPKLDWAPRVFRAKTTFQALARDSVEAYCQTMSIVREAMRAQLFSARVPRRARRLPRAGSLRAARAKRGHR